MLYLLQIVKFNLSKKSSLHKNKKVCLNCETNLFHQTSQTSCDFVFFSSTSTRINWWNETSPIKPARKCVQAETQQVREEEIGAKQPKNHPRGYLSNSFIPDSKNHLYEE